MAAGLTPSIRGVATLSAAGCRVAAGGVKNPVELRVPPLVPLITLGVQMLLDVRPHLADDGTAVAAG